MNWKDRLLQMPELWEFENWGHIDIDEVPSAHQDDFLRNKHVVGAVLSGMKNKDVASRFNVSPAQITKLMNGALGGDAGDEPTLLDSLVPYRRTKKAQRSAPLQKLGEHRGYQSAFTGLLAELPELKERLDEFLVQGLARGINHEVPTNRALFGHYKTVLKQLNWPKDLYPYTTKRMAYTGLINYSRIRIEELRRRRTVQRKNKQTFRTMSETQAFREIQIDEQIVDMETYELFYEPGQGLAPQRISRCSLILAVDVGTYSVLGYVLVLTDSPNQDDLLTLFDQLIKRWKPAKLTMPGLEYIPGSGFPSSFIPEKMRFTFGLVRFDNALIHHAHSIRDAVTNKFGAAIHLGLPGTPRRRPWVEHMFNVINQEVHRLPSNTGSHLRDPKREPKANRKQVPVISTEHFDEILSVAFTEYNIMPRTRLAGQTPLEVVEYQINSGYVPMHAVLPGDGWSPFEAVEKCAVHFSGEKIGHVNFLDTKYTADCLHHNIVAKGELLTIRFDRRNPKLVRAYKADGRYLGEISAPLSNQRLNVSYQQMKKIIADSRSTRSHRDDPLSPAMGKLRRKKPSPKVAQKIARIERAQIVAQALEKKGPKKAGKRLSSPEPDRGKKFKWTPKASQKE